MEAWVWVKVQSWLIITSKFPVSMNRSTMLYFYTWSNNNNLLAIPWNYTSSNKKHNKLSGSQSWPKEMCFGSCNLEHNFDFILCILEVTTFDFRIIQFSTFLDCTMWDELWPKNPCCLEQKSRTQDLLAFWLYDLHFSSNSVSKSTCQHLPTNLSKNQQWCGYSIAIW